MSVGEREDLINVNRIAVWITFFIPCATTRSARKPYFINFIAVEMNEIANNLSEMPAIRYPPFIVRSTAGHRKGSHLKYAEVCNESASVLTP